MLTNLLLINLLDEIHVQTEYIWKFVWKQEILKTYRSCKYSKKKNFVVMWDGQTIHWTCFNKFQRDKRGDKP